MSNRARRGDPGDEMFLEQPHTADSPTIEPLRINKNESFSPEQRAGSAASQRTGYNKTTAYTLPPGASSSAAPLPYPDDRPQPPPNTGRLPYPDAEAAVEPRKYSSPPTSSSSRYSPPMDPSRSGIPHYPPALRTDGRDSPQASSLAERRGNAPKPLPDSPGPELPDKEGLFQRMPRRSEAAPAPAVSETRKPSKPVADAYNYNQHYYPPPDPTSPDPQGAPGLQIPNPNSVNRLASTASTSTTRAQRGSPPPPETPILPSDDHAGGGIEARYAAAGIAGASTLTGLQAQNIAAAARAQQYASQPLRVQVTPQQQQKPPRRPWTPTELPGSTPHGPPTVYQGPGQASSSPPIQAPVGLGRQTSPVMSPGRASVSAIEQDIQRLHVSGSPPPAYSSVSQGRPSGATTAQGYPSEKHSSVSGPAAAGAGLAAGAAVAAVTSALPSGNRPEDVRHDSHPAFANDPRQRQGSSSQAAQGNFPGASPQPQMNSSPVPPGAGPASPPPLPEGWIAHLDPNSGQYYYIHLPTQSTQWEFPKGPTPLNLNEPLSPSASIYHGNPLNSPGLSTYSGKPLASPGFMPSTPGYAESVMSFQSNASTITGFTGPPPSSGVDVYKVAPTNGVYFGPYLKYTNMDLEKGRWLGSILLVTDAPQPPTIHIHQSIDLSPNPRQLKASPIHKHQRWTFYRYEVDLVMEDHGGAKWTYAITSHLGCTRYEFLVAGRHETNWRFIATSGNDFSLNVNANERSRLGGIGYMWKDIMAKHVECGGFHTQLGLGNQIFADRIWREIPLLKQWLSMSGKENRKNEPWTASHEEDVTHAYFHFYTSHFDQPYLREAFAQIPHILQLDDHDIFDGFGSYPEYMQFSNMFKNIGRISIELYLLFQHHTTLEILRNVSTDIDIFTITGTGWHFVKFLGPAVAVVGPDCRSERNPHQVMAGPTYQGLFPKVATLPNSVQHCIWMISVPIVYPRLEAAESIAHTVATGKKAVTGAYNVLGKVTSSVAGVVGAKAMVGSGFDSVKKAVGKSGLMGGILSPFGDIDMLDELKDAWTHDSKDLERTYLIRTLQGISRQRSIRMTFLSGAVDCCGAGLVHDPAKPSDHKTMYQLISASVVNTPPSTYILKMLHNHKPLYIPANGQRSTNAPSDTKEDMMEIFQAEPDGRPRDLKKLMGRRNYVAIVAYDPEVVHGTYGPTAAGHGGGRLSLAADFMVQGDGSYGGVSKYGPVIIPSLEYGR